MGWSLLGVGCRGDMVGVELEEERLGEPLGVDVVLESA